jgi:hypothetical protein
MTAIQGWQLKRERAAVHFAELDRCVKDYLAEKPYRLETEVEEGGPMHLRLRVEKAPPVAIAPIVGDLVHNLRSALDTRVFAVAENLFGQLGGKKEKAIRLPVGETSERRFSGLTGAWPALFGAQGAELLRSVLRPLQMFAPASGYWRERYGSGDDADGEADAKRNQNGLVQRLVLLETLSNIDKHRRIEPLWYGIEDMRSFSDADEPVEFTIQTPPWGDGDLIATLTPGWPNSQAKRDFTATPTLVLPGDYRLYSSAASDLDNIDFFVGQALDLLDFEERRVLSELRL